MGICDMVVVNFTEYLIDGKHFNLKINFSFLGQWALG